MVNPKPSPAGRFRWLVWTPGCFLFPLNRAGAEWSRALGRMRQIKRPRSSRTGETLRQVSLQPTEASQHNRTVRRNSGRGRDVPARKGEGRRATDRSQREGPQTRRLDGTDIDLRGHQLCGARNSQGTNPKTGHSCNQPSQGQPQPTFLTQFSSKDRRWTENKGANPRDWCCDGTRQRQREHRIVQDRTNAGSASAQQIWEVLLHGSVQLRLRRNSFLRQVSCKELSVTQSERCLCERLF